MEDEEYEGASQIVLTPAERQVVIERSETAIVGMQQFKKAIEDNNMAVAAKAWELAVSGMNGVNDMLNPKAEAAAVVRLKRALGLE
jgi:hypothetical protein